MKPTLLATLLCALPLNASAAEERLNWQETFETGAAPHVVISNVWGNVRVRAGQAGQVKVSAEERRLAPNDAKLESSRSLIWLDVQADPQRVSLDVTGDDRHKNRGITCRGCRLEFQFDVLVPPDASLSVATVNDGVIDVQGVTGLVNASNVNGPVTIVDLHNCGDVRSINGDVSLDFAAQPDHDCRLDTINGDMIVTLPAGAGLDLAIDLFNGRIYSGLDVTPLALPATVKRSDTASGSRFEVEKFVGLRLGRGGPRFEFESMNGDVRIDKTP